MENVARSAKSSDDWEERDLAAFNILIIEKTADEFFGRPLPDQVDFSPILLNNPERMDRGSADENAFFFYMKCATVPWGDTDEVLVFDFVRHLLHLAGYDMSEAFPYLVHAGPGMAFEICGDIVPANPNLCLVHYFGGPAYDEKKFVLLVREDHVGCNQWSPNFGWS